MCDLCLVINYDRTHNEAIKWLWTLGRTPKALDASPTTMFIWCAEWTFMIPILCLLCLIIDTLCIVNGDNVETGAQRGLVIRLNISTTRLPIAFSNVYSSGLIIVPIPLSEIRSLYVNFRHFLVGLIPIHVYKLRSWIRTWSIFFGIASPAPRDKSQEKQWSVSRAHITWNVLYLFDN